jgi:ligand-binding sensor domain-containing protein
MKWIFFCSMLNLTATILFAQQEYRFEHISSDHGLSQSAVTSIIQDKYGYLWVGTLDGLNRYDGAAFKIYHSSQGDSRSLPNSSIGYLFLDAKERLWVSTTGFLSQYQPENDNFINYKLTLKDSQASPYNIRHMFSLSSDSLILRTQAGLVWFDLKTGHHGEYTNGDKEKGGSIFGYFRSSTGYEIIIRDGFTVQGKQVSETKWKLLLEHPFPIKGSLLDSLGLFIQTRDGVYKYNQEQNKLELRSPLTSDNSFNGYKQGLIRRANGELWIMHGIISIFDSSFKLKTTLLPVDNNPQSISEYLSCLFESKDGVVWVGSNGLGLNKYNPLLSVFNYISKFPGSAFSLDHQFVTSVFTSDDNTLYVGTLSGLDLIDLTTNKSKHFERLGKNGRKIRVARLVKGKDGRLWVGTSEGIMTFDGKSLQSSVAGIKDYVDDLSVDDEGNLIVATQHHVMLLDHLTNTTKILILQGTLAIKKIKDVYWTENEGKLLLYKEGNERPYKTYEYSANQAGSFPNVLTKCFYEDREGKIWIGTSGAGLLLFESASETFKQFTVDDGLPNNIVYGILEDDQGILWLSTNNGICAFNKLTGKAIRNFFKDDGLQANEFNT